MEQDVSCGWDELVQALSEQNRRRFEQLLKRTLKRSFERDRRMLQQDVPPSVQSEAVGIWRKRFVKQGGSKTAARRFGYERLCGDRAFQQIVQRLLERYRKRHQLPDRASTPDIDAMGISKACDLYRSLVSSRARQR